MPIKALERQLDAQGVLGNMPRWGKLRKGAAKPNEKAPGRDLDFFRLQLDSQYEATVRPVFEQLFGDKPTEFHGVYIAADSAKVAFDYWYEQHTFSHLEKRCDGEEIHLSLGDFGRYDDTPHACTCNPLDRDCGISGKLDIVIPELCELVGWGKLTVITSSIYDCIEMASKMRLADAFMQKIPNVAFWSVPFTIGRAPRQVPVTMNGKKSRKTMSLLYAQVDTDFHQKVFAGVLTHSTKLLLQGTNPETGELPEIEIEQSLSWDRDYVANEILWAFEGERHLQNAIDKMIADGELTDDLTDEQAVAVILENRERRQREKAEQASGGNALKTRKKGSKSSAADQTALSDLEWLQNTERVNKFVSQAILKLKLDMNGILRALSAISDNELATIQDFKGTDAEAWTACIAYAVDYDAAKIPTIIPGTDAKSLEMVAKVIGVIARAQIPS